MSAMARPESLPHCALPTSAAEGILREIVAAEQAESVCRARVEAAREDVNVAKVEVEAAQSRLFEAARAGDMNAVPAAIEALDAANGVLAEAMVELKEARLERKPAQRRRANAFAEATRVYPLFPDDRY